MARTPDRSARYDTGSPLGHRSRGASFLEEGGLASMLLTFPCAYPLVARFDRGPTKRGTIKELALCAWRGHCTVLRGLLHPSLDKETSRPILSQPGRRQAIARESEKPQTTMSRNVILGPVLRLLGRDLHRQTNRLTLQLRGQALRRLEESYTFSAPLINVETGDLVAQADVISADWTYPTAWGEAEGMVSHEVLLPLIELAPNQHRLKVGAHDRDIGEPSHPRYDGSMEPDRTKVPEKIRLP